MEPILLYGFPEGSSLGIVAALEWSGMPYRLCRVDMLGAMREPAYARINPRHETPVLITGDGRPLTETMAIAYWLEARDTHRRISFDPQSAEADRMHQLMAFVNSSFTGAFSPLWAAFETDPPEPDYQEALRRFGRAEVEARHEQMEAMMPDSSFLVGDRPTLADGLLVGVARWLDFHEVAARSRWPRLAAWRTRIEADPAVRFAAEVEAGERPAGSGGLQGHVDLEEVIAEFGRDP